MIITVERIKIKIKIRERNKKMSVQKKDHRTASVKERPVVDVC